MQKIKAGNIGGKAKYLIPIGVFVICIFAVLLSGNHFTSYQLPVEGYSSTCESCGKTAYYSDQFTYDSNWGTYYLVNGTSFPLILKVNDMFDPSATTDVFTAYRITLRNKNTGSLIKDFSGTFPTAGYMESYRMEYYYTVTGEIDVEATVLLSRNGGLSWEESYYYMTNAPPVWHFRQTHVTSTDTDKDNIPDNLDACPSQPETYNGYLDNDGCPDTVPSSSTGDSNPPSTPSVPDDSTSPVDDGSGDPATPDDGTSDTSTPSDDDTSLIPKYDESKNIPISLGTPCAEWVEGKIGFVAYLSDDLAGLLAGILTPMCWAYKIVAYGANLPVIMILNIINLFNYVCASSFGITYGYIIPVALVALFVLLLLVPDDIISFSIAVFFAYILGTTAPVAGTLSVLTAFGSSFATIGTAGNIFVLASSVQFSSKAIFIVLMLLAGKETFFPQGVLTIPFVSYVKRGDDIIPKETQMNVKYGTGISQLRHVVAELVLLVGGFMWLECHWGIPLYTAMISLIDSLLQGLQYLEGVL